MSNLDIRWKQRFSNYSKALLQLEVFLQKKQLNDLEKQGLIQAFEYTYELAWNVLKDYLQEQGYSSIIGSRDAITEGFRLGLIQDGEAWMKMFQDRNKTSHTYNEKTAAEVVLAIQTSYIVLFQALREYFKTVQ